MNVDHLRSDMAEGKVAQHSVVPLLHAEVPGGQLGGPGDVVVGEHHALGVACGSTGVDKGAALVDGNASKS